MDALSVVWTNYFIILLSFGRRTSGSGEIDKNKDPHDVVVRIPTPCEVCRVFAHEMDEKLKETSSKMKLEFGSKPTREDQDPRRIDYSRSELRLLEILDTVCSNVSAYYVHNKDGMQRYAKQESETLDALNSLRRRGVKVEIGMPWEVVENQPNKEISALKRKCEALVEDHEDDLTAWFFQHQEKPVQEFFCRNKFLRGENSECLDQPWLPFGEPFAEDSEKKPKGKDEL